MFATHYHELMDLARVKPHAANHHVAAREYGDDVVFLRKLTSGGTSRSFGIQVAKMAGLPEIVIQRAREILEELMEQHANPMGISSENELASSSPQLELFTPHSTSEVERILRETDLDRVTPLEALALLARLKDLADKT
jgi:DNA mismatch repair protein MutS